MAKRVVRGRGDGPENIRGDGAQHKRVRYLSLLKDRCKALLVRNSQSMNDIAPDIYHSPHAFIYKKL